MDNGKSVRELGMAYRPIQESIRDSIAWFRDEGLFKGPPLPTAAAREIPVPVENPRVGVDTVFELGTPETTSSNAPQTRRPKPPEGPA